MTAGRAARLELTARGLVLAATLLAFALRALSLLSQSLWRDEVDALLFATRPLSQLLAMFRQPGQNGPLFFLALRPWLAAAGHSEYALRFPSVLFGTLAIPLTYVLLRRMADLPVALIGALLMAVAPYGVWYGQEAKMYALLTVLGPASLLAILWLRERRGWQPWVALYVVTSVAAYTHLLAVLIIPIQALWLVLIPWTTQPLRRAAAGLAYLAALALPYVPLLAWAPRILTSNFQTGHPFVALDLILQILAGAFSRGVLGIEPISLLPYMVALVAGVFVWPVLAAGRVEGQPRGGAEWLWRTSEGRSARWRSVLLLLFWLLLPPILIYLVSLGMPIFTDRYLIWAMPAYLALLACGLVALGRWWRPLGIAAAGVILALNGWSMYLQATEPIKADFRSAAAYVVARYQPGDKIMYQIPYNRYTFSYYASGRDDPEDPAWAGLEGPYTNYGMSEAEADAWIATRLGGTHVVWLVASEVPMWDARNLTEQWFDANATATDRGDFARVRVIRYER
ncbi:MAG: glycosyltransferase family 39 protein [Nitrososphaerales archaeon]